MLNRPCLTLAFRKFREPALQGLPFSQGFRSSDPEGGRLVSTHRLPDPLPDPGVEVP
jgi:hypothetical protein